MQGDLCRVKTYQQTGKFRFHRLVGTKLQQFRNRADAAPIREVSSLSLEANLNTAGTDV